MKLYKKLSNLKFKKRLKYAQIAQYFDVTEQAIKNWCNKEYCPKRLRLKHAELMVAFSDGYITLEDCGHAPN
jgi:hypothetical protein